MTSPRKDRCAETRRPESGASLVAAYAGIRMIVISDCFCRRGEVRHGRYMSLEILQSVRQSDAGRSGGRTLRNRGGAIGLRSTALRNR